MKKTRIKIVGATGYGGVGILELLLGHPHASVECLVALQDVGRSISEVYPHLQGFCDLNVVAPDSAQAQQAYDLVFFATPDGVGMQQAQAELERGARIIDYSGDFRFDTPEAYADYARRLGKKPKHTSPELLSDTVYGLGELHRAEIRAGKRLVGNPGCFAVSCILGLAPAAQARLIDFSSIICDCKTGVSGAGKKPGATFHFPSRYEQMNAYRLSGHQHVCEIERELSQQANENIQITFTAQVVPTCRGIMSCLYGTLCAPMSEQKIIGLYRDFYRNSPFVRVLESTAPSGTQFVRGTNYCNLVISVDERTRRLRVVSYIDNLMKGQAGNALQNMNLLFGYAETTGLNRPGQYP
jgi:N-acetyl-gamma-glutamyl-phosphate reductase